MMGALNFVVNLGIIVIAGISEVPIPQIRVMIDYARCRFHSAVSRLRSA